jgi:hypothetical protein
VLRRRLLITFAFTAVLAVPAPAGAYTISGPDEPVAEGDAATFTITPELGDTPGTTVTVVPMPGTASAADFDAREQQVEAGLLPTEVEIPTVDDDVDEPDGDETFTVALEGEDGDPASAAIADGDPAPPLSIDDLLLDEAAGSATLTVTAAGASTRAISASWATVEGSATAADFTTGSGTITIPAGQRAAKITVPVTNDTLDEDAELFGVKLSAPQNATIAKADGIVGLRDDDQRVVTVSDATAAESDGASVPLQFTFSLNAATSRTVTVSFATADVLARAPSDYLSRLGTVVFAPGETQKTIEVAVVGDNAAEGTESLLLRLTAATGARIGRAAGAGVITDDDGPGPVAVATGSAPRVALAAPRLRGRNVTVGVRCPRGGARCDGRLALYTVGDRRSKVPSLRRERRVGARRYRIAAGASRTLTYRLSAGLFRDARRAGRLKVRAYAVTLGSGGDADTRSKSATLRVRR